jgi:hypothetical protein
MILAGCSSTKVVKLSPAKGASKEFGSRSQFVEAIQADSSQASFASKLGMDSFVVGRFNYYPSSYSVAASRMQTQNSDPQEYVKRHQRVVSGTSEEIPYENFNTEILFLFGRKIDGQYLVVPDLNNNKHFSDDSVFVFDRINENQIVSTKGLDSFPHIKVDNVRSYYNKKVRRFSHRLIIEPVLFHEVGEQENRNALTLRVASVEYRKGSFRYKGKRYQVAARNALLPYLYFDPRVIKIKFADAGDPSAFQKSGGRLPTYFVGDTVLLGQHQVVIKKVAPLLNKIKFQTVRKKPSKNEMISMTMVKKEPI